MEDVIHKLKSLIKTETTENMSKSHESYVSGLKTALRIVEESVADNLIPNNKYYVIMYRDGNKYLPYIEEMRLYKISIGSIKTSYCFTRKLEQGKYIIGTPDLVLQSKKGLSERVFFTHEQAENAISHV